MVEKERIMDSKLSITRIVILVLLWWSIQLVPVSAVVETRLIASLHWEKAGTSPAATLINHLTLET